MGGTGRRRAIAIAGATWLLASLGLGCGDDRPPASDTDTDAASSSGPAPEGSTTAEPDPGACSPGETRACYDGPPGTEGVGVCAAGQQVCTADGQGWSECEGQTKPEPAERCDTLQDDDCDGLSVCEPALAWWHEIPGYVRLVAAQPDGGVVVAGAGGFGDFQGTWLDGYFVISLDASGQRVWSYDIDSRSYVDPEVLVVDDTGAVVVAGRYDGTPDLGGGPLPPRWGFGGFAVRYLDGAHVWSHSNASGGCVAAAVGSDGTTYLVSDGNPKLSSSLRVEAVTPDGSVAWWLTGEGLWDEDTSSLVVAPSGPAGAEELVLMVVAGGDGVTLGDMPISTADTFEPFVVRIGLDGTPLDHRRLLGPEVLGTYDVQAFARPGGIMTAATVLQHDLEDGQGLMIGGLLTALDDGLAPVSQRFLGRGTWLNGAAPYPDGTTLLNVDFDGVLELGPIGVGESGTALALVDDEGSARWAEMLYSGGNHQLVSISAAPDGSVFVVGLADEGGVLADTYVSGVFVAKLRP